MSIACDGMKQDEESFLNVGGYKYLFDVSDLRFELP